MIGNRGRRAVVVALAAGLVVTAACAPLDAMGGGVLAGPGSRDAVLEGEVRSVDPRRSRIEVRDQWNRGHSLRIDRSTQVVYRQRDYPVTALERGDRVRVRVTHDRNGALWAERIDVRESVRDRGRAAVRTERLNGTVSRVDARRGHFTLQHDRNRSVVVYVPARMSRDDARRFDGLRRGDRVRVEVVGTGRGAVELVRFR